MKSMKKKPEAQQRKIHAFRMETRKQHTPEGGVPCGDHSWGFGGRCTARPMTTQTQIFYVGHLIHKEAEARLHTANA